MNENPKVVEKIAKKFGSHVVASIDVKKSIMFIKFFNNGKSFKILLKDHIKLLENLELVRSFWHP